uniref:Homocysteine S-methyltransferase n=1 Tax=Strigomonas oncopelti TaxID=5657 RepID=U5KL83_STROO|nr:homocysteine S-methyltransferase [Strigomonas oncopelti]
MDIKSYLSDPKAILVLDGALATELEARGCDLADPLWSGKVVLENPSLVYDVESHYLQSGARCLITASYQITPQSLMKHRGLSETEAVEMIECTVQIAQQARDIFLNGWSEAPKPHVFIAGSVGPYGACLGDGSEYTGAYTREPEELKVFHRTRIATLLKAGVDFLAIETQPSAAEVLTLVDLLRDEFPQALAFVAFTISTTDPHRLCDGTPLAEVLPRINASEQIFAVGANCVALTACTSILAHLATLTKKPLLAYPNSGEVYDAHDKKWHQGTTMSHNIAKECEQWSKMGTRLIGGCCRTRPKDIADIKANLTKLGFKCDR